MEPQQIKSNILLLITGMIWGFAFVAQRIGMDYVGPFTFNGVRFALGSLSLIPLVLVTRNKEARNSSVQLSTGKLILFGGITGLALFMGASLQQVGLVYTTAGKAGFITGLYVVIVPILWFFRGRKSGSGTWLGAVMAAIGLYLLSVTGGFNIQFGDLLEIIGAFFWAIHILLIDHFSKRINPIILSMIQFAFCSVFSLITAGIVETIVLQGILDAALPILYGGLGSVGIAYTLQVVAQRNAHPAHAAIILSLESVFAAVGGWLILNEMLTIRSKIGCSLMFAGMLVSQLKRTGEMIYLGLAILAACTMGLLFKYSEIKGLHRYTITAANYLTAAVIALIMAIRTGAIDQIGLVSSRDILSGIAEITLEGGSLSPGNSVLWAMIVGLMTGFFFLNALIYFQKSIFENGIAISGMISRLGVLIPLVASIIIWQEIPSPIQNLGIALAIGVIILTNFDFERQGRLEWRSSLLQLFFLSGAGIFCNKLFQKYALLEHKSLFLLFTFSTALILALRVAARKKQAVTPVDLTIGLLVGSANLMANFFLIMALSQIKAAIVFPVSSAGAIIAMSLGGIILFGEKLRSRDIIAVCLTVIAVLLINR